MFVPWGELSWVLGRLPQKPWSCLGCVAREERSLSLLKSRKFDPKIFQMVRIFDSTPGDDAEELSALDKRRDEALNIGLSSEKIFDTMLLSSLDEIYDIIKKNNDYSSSLIIDISSFPKRWFFPMLRMALRNFEFSDILVIYSTATKYGETLSFDPESIRAIPGFTSTVRRHDCDVALVSIGYHSSSVLNLFDVERPRAMKILFPFPPGPPGIRRNWQIVERFERAIRLDNSRANFDMESFSEVRIGALDLPQNFNALKKSTDSGLKSSLVAPFGPKPVSLAMCLFSLAAENSGLSEVPVYYAQPTRYSADYTLGVGLEDMIKSIYAYPIKINGKELYYL